MNWWKQAAEQPKNPNLKTNPQFNEMFGDGFDDFFNTKQEQEVRREPVKKVPTMLTLYRGFDADLNKLERTGGGYRLIPDRSEQGVLWFSCPTFQRDALEVATRGRYLLTYPLQSVRHVEEIYYQQGGPPKFATPDYFSGLTSPTENSRFHMGYELPEGWAFSYKVQKFIIGQVPIVITPNMITEQKGEGV